jgi:hypothetical protein
VRLLVRDYRLASRANSDKLVRNVAEPVTVMMRGLPDHMIAQGNLILLRAQPVCLRPDRSLPV